MALPLVCPNAEVQHQTMTKILCPTCQQQPRVFRAPASSLPEVPIEVFSDSIYAP